MPMMSLKVTHPPSRADHYRIEGRGKPLFRGTGETDYVGGNCGPLIAANMGPAQRVIVDAAVGSACGAENESSGHLKA